MIDYLKGIAYLKPCNYSIVASNLVDSPMDEFDLAKTYSKNEITKQNEKTFISRADSNKGNLPLITPLIWRRIGTINTEAWRDDSFFTQSTAQDEIVLVFDAQQAEGIALANVIADEIIIEQIKTNGTVVQSQTKKMTTITSWDWIAYWFYDPIRLNQVHFDIPIAEADYIRVRIKATGTVAMVGSLQLGTIGHVGCEVWGTTTIHRLVKTPQGLLKPVMDVSLNTKVKRKDRLLIANQLASLKDKFTFYFNNSTKDEIVCAKLEDIEITDDDIELSNLSLTMKGMSNE